MHLHHCLLSSRCPSSFQAMDLPLSPSDMYIMLSAGTCAWQMEESIIFNNYLTFSLCCISVAASRAVMLRRLKVRFFFFFFQVHNTKTKAGDICVNDHFWGLFFFWPQTKVFQQNVGFWLGYNDLWGCISRSAVLGIMEVLVFSKNNSFLNKWFAWNRDKIMSNSMNDLQNVLSFKSSLLENKCKHCVII